MTTIKSAEEAYNDAVAKICEAKKAEIAKAIDVACAKSQFKCFCQMTPEIATYLRGLGYSVDEQTNFGKVQGYTISWAKKEEKAPAIEYDEVASVEELQELLAGDEAEVNVAITEDMDIPELAVGAGKVVNMKVDAKLSATKSAFKVADGGQLTLTGDGVIESTDKGTTSIMYVEGEGSNVVLDGPTITTGEGADNYHYGIYLSKDGSLTVKSGKIKVATSAAITTNNTTGGAAQINIEGGEILSDNAYAMYLPSHNNTTISGNAVVQGIVARMGKFDIKDNAKVIPTICNAEYYDNIGATYQKSGYIFPGDTIAVLAGTYTDAAGTDCEIKVSGNATVESNFRAAIGIYAVDTKEAQNVTVNVANKANVKTTDAEFDAVKVYDHDYIKGESDANGKGDYVAKVDSNIVIK